MKTTISALCVLFALANVSAFELPPDTFNNQKLVIYDTVSAPKSPSKDVTVEWITGFDYTGMGGWLSHMIVYDCYSAPGTGTIENVYNYGDDTITSNDTLPHLYSWRADSSHNPRLSRVDCVALSIIIRVKERVCTNINNVRFCSAWDIKTLDYKAKYDTLTKTMLNKVETPIRYNPSELLISPNPATSTVFLTNPTSASARIAIYTVAGRLVDRLEVGGLSRAVWSCAVPGKYLVSVDGRSARLLTVR